MIVPESTWIATAAPITYLRATPMFCDIDPVNWCLDPAAVERAITPRTKCIIVVDLFGNMPRMAELVAIAERHGIPLVEDSAEALGSTYNGVTAGKFGVGSVFSFHRTKTVVARYEEGLSRTTSLRLPLTLKGNGHAWHQYVARHPGRERILARLAGKGIALSVHYPVPIHLMPAYARLGYAAGSLPETERAAAEVFSLPMYPSLPDESRDRVIEALLSAVSEGREVHT